MALMEETMTSLVLVASNGDGNDEAESGELGRLSVVVLYSHLFWQTRKEVSNCICGGVNCEWF